MGHRTWIETGPSDKDRNERGGSQARDAPPRSGGGGGTTVAPRDIPRRGEDNWRLPPREKEDSTENTAWRGRERYNSGTERGGSSVSKYSLYMN